ncbi:MAG TPA: GPR1/FUN34/YaaH family transporter [Streptosporangiaceae bacterium]|jgi:succinate-acetate transporter protein|nr:GPR1/FUN34/YaaH family transporter [Streptosporangiaceae bacterium]
MTAVDSGASDSVRSTPETAAAAPATAAPAPAPVWAGDPMAVGLPSFIVGSVALGLVLVGMVPATAVGASLPIILAATAAGLFIATVWSAVVGQSAVACVFGIFAGFWLSYAVLVLGLVHGWFGIGLLAVKSTQELFLTAWLVIIVMLTLATLRLPVAYTALFGLIDLALLLVLIGTANASSGTLKVAGYVVLLFAALGVYLFFNTVSQATGGKALPLGKPLMS